MSIYKRKKIWHCDFTENGQRFRRSLETTDGREAKAKERDLITRAKSGQLTIQAGDFARLRFAAAAEKHLADRTFNLADRTLQTERERLKPLCACFGEITLRKISAERLREYIKKRKSAGVANKTINLELGVVRGLLKRARLWQLLADEIRPLPVQRQIGRALSQDEKSRLQNAASLKPEWENARLAMILAFNTTMRACELKGLQWRDIDLQAHTLTIRKSKTDAGRRVLPLNRDAWDAIMELWRRSQITGGCEPRHYVFPACENGNFDFSKPQKSWRSAWRSLRNAAGLPTLRFHDLRHHAITELAESQASDQTIMAIAGHVSREMLSHYSHVRLDTKRKALDGLSQQGEFVGSVTNEGTNAPEGHGTNS